MQVFGGGIVLVGGGRMAAAIVGVGGVGEELEVTAAGPPPQLAAKAATRITRAAQNHGLGLCTIPPFPEMRVQAHRPNYSC